MKRSFNIISRAGFISAAFLLFVCASTVTSAETNGTEIQVSSNSISTINEDESSWTEEHEGNGPEGGREMPMERMPVTKVALASGLLLASVSLAWYQKRENGRSKAKG